MDDQLIDEIKNAGLSAIYTEKGIKVWQNFEDPIPREIENVALWNCTTITTKFSIEEHEETSVGFFLDLAFGKLSISIEDPAWITGDSPESSLKDKEIEIYKRLFVKVKFCREFEDRENLQSQLLKPSKRFSAKISKLVGGIQRYEIDRSKVKKFKDEFITRAQMHEIKDILHSVNKELLDSKRQTA